MADRRVSVGVAKRRLGCSDDHVRRLIGDGALDAVDIRRPGAKRALWAVSTQSIERYEREPKSTNEKCAARAARGSE